LPQAARGKEGSWEAEKIGRWEKEGSWEALRGAQRTLF